MTTDATKDVRWMPFTRQVNRKFYATGLDLFHQCQ